MAFFEVSRIFDLLSISAGCFFVLYALFAYLQNTWTKKGIPFSNVNPLFGNIKDVVLRRKTMKDVITEFYLEHKDKPYMGFFSFSKPMVMINDMELVKSVLISDFSAFTDRNFGASPSDPLEYHNMFTLKGQQWKNLRMKLTPTFTSGKMKKMFELVDACGKGLVTCFKKEAGEDAEVEIKELSSRYTTDVIATCAFGIEGNSLKDPESVFRKMMKKALTFSFLQHCVLQLMVFSPWLVEKLKLSLTSHDVAEFFRKTVWDTVEHREKNNVARNDFLQLLMQIRKSGSLKDDDDIGNGEITEEISDKIDLDGDKLVAQCFLFLTAGFDTSSSLMSYALYEMALNPDVQKKVYEEITTVLAKHGGKVTYDAVQDMTYLHMVAQETLRKYPALLMLDRRVTRTYRLPGTAIELSPGDSVMVPVIGIHYDPDIYPEPHRFDPDRFSEEKRGTRPACAFLGFGDGPRHCIGMRMGLLQSKVGLIYTLLEYGVSPTTSTPIPLKFLSSTFLLLDGGIPLRLKKRNS